MFEDMSSVFLSDVVIMDGFACFGIDPSGVMCVSSPDLTIKVLDLPWKEYPESDAIYNEFR